MKRVAVFVIFLAMSAVRLAADTVAYAGRHEYSAGSATYLAAHVHDWDKVGTPDWLGVGIGPGADDAIFSARNTAAWVEVRHRADDKLIWRSASPALTYLWISPDESLLVGLSNIKRANPVQLAIWDLASGKLIWREHITPTVARLTAEEWNRLAAEYPEKRAALEQSTRPQGRARVVDFLRMGWKDQLGAETWNALFSYRHTHPYSYAIVQSVTNQVEWCREPDPAPRLDHDREGRRRLSLLDRAGLRFPILLPDPAAETPGPTPATAYPYQFYELSDPVDFSPPDWPGASGAAKLFEFVSLPAESTRQAKKIDGKGKPSRGHAPPAAAP